MVSYLNGLVYLPVFGLDPLTYAAKQVDEQLTLYAVVDHHSCVGYVQHYEADDGDANQDPSQNDLRLF